MRQIAGSRSLGFYLEELWFTEAALAADPDTADLAEVFETAIHEWDDVAKRERNARRATVRAEAVVAVRNEQIDSETVRFSGVVLVEAGNDRKSSLFRRFFPEAPSVFVARGLRDQCEQTRDRIVPEIAKQPDTSMLRPFAERLAALAKAALAALTTRTKTRGEAATVASDIADWKEGINRLRTTTYAELLKRSAEKRYGRDWADTFFRRDDGSAGAADDPTPPSPPPTP